MIKGFVYNIIPGTMDAQRDTPWICRELLGSEWGRYLSKERIEEAMKRSQNYGIYEFIGGNMLIAGYARVVTDGALFSSLCDLIVTQEKRGQGLGRQLLEHILESPGVKGTECILHTTQAGTFYAKFGFRIVKQGVMLRTP